MARRADSESVCMGAEGHSRAQSLQQGSLPMSESAEQSVEEHLVHVTAGSATIEGNLNLPESARAVVLFAHGSGSSRYSSRNRHVARVLNEAKLATVLIDLLTSDEEAIDARTAHLRFDIALLEERLVGATDWLVQYSDMR